VWGFGFVALPLFCGVAVSARNWPGDIHTSAARSTNPAQVLFIQWLNFCFPRN
jgi:hypothetical protein